MVEILYVIAAVLLSATAIIAMYRIIAGPTILDRIIASDVLLTTLILVVAAEMIINAHTRTIPLMVILAATAIFGTVSVARFVTKTEGGRPQGGAS